MQELLNELGFGFTLLPHQFDAARFVAESRGGILADVMGLGKTVELLAGARLYAASEQVAARSILICCPNAAIISQWRDHAIQAGFASDDIALFKRKDTTVLPRVVLLTRHALSKEFRLALRGSGSLLFPEAPHELCVQLDNVKKTAVGEAKPETKDGETEHDSIVKHLRTFEPSKTFQMVIVDEAHFLRNLTAFWSMGCALLCMHASKRVMATGTPYNNRPSDLAALMTFVDPSSEWATTRHWKHALENNHAAIEQWRNRYCLRRTKDVLVEHLPSKFVTTLYCELSEREKPLYLEIEQRFNLLLQEFASVLAQSPGTPEARAKKQRRLKYLFDRLLILIQNMRLTTLHPITVGGRFFTRTLSALRKHGKEPAANACVVCRDQEENPQEEVDPGDGEQIPEEHKREDYGDLGILPASLCQADKVFCMRTAHLAHQACAQRLAELRAQCPKCANILRDCDAGATHTPRMNNAFVPSTKLMVLRQWVHNVPRSDKMIIFSGFKSFLDLAECCLAHDGVGVERFDGDDLPEAREVCLARFKTDPKARVLLSTLQSGGVGLNITAANHVLFCDRWFNPFTHEQAMDRVHRIGQTKECFITFLDARHTFDEVMAFLHRTKSENAKFVLADFGAGAGGQGLGYREVVGAIRTKFLEMVRNRDGSASVGKHRPRKIRKLLSLQ